MSASELIKITIGKRFGRMRFSVEKQILIKRATRDKNAVRVDSTLSQPSLILFFTYSASLVYSRLKWVNLTSAEAGSHSIGLRCNCTTSTIDREHWSRANGKKRVLIRALLAINSASHRVADRRPKYIKSKRRRSSTSTCWHVCFVRLTSDIWRCVGNRYIPHTISPAHSRPKWPIDCRLTFAPIHSHWVLIKIHMCVRSAPTCHRQ